MVQSKTVTPNDDMAFTYLPYLGVSGRIGLGPLMVGLRGDAAQDVIFGRSEYFGTGFLGLRLAGERVSLEATGEFGAHSFEGIGNSFNGLLNAPSVTLPLAGAQIRLAFRPDPHIPGSVGLAFFVRRDLGTERITAMNDVNHCFIACDPETHDYTVGGTTAGLGFDFQYDFWRR
jgi:hypothetical protein